MLPIRLGGSVMNFSLEQNVDILSAYHVERFTHLRDNEQYQDDEERAFIEGIEAQIYDVKEEDLLRVMNILKAQAKQPKAEW